MCHIKGTRDDDPLGSPVVPFHPFFGEGPPTKIDYSDYSKKGTLVLSSLLEDLVLVSL